MTQQTWKPQDYQTHAHFVPALGKALLAWVDLKPDTDVLDLGCGDGTLTAELAQSGARIIGIDSDAAMIAAARARGLDVRLGNAQDFTLDAPVDVVFSNATLHWVSSPEAALRAIHRALKAGGQFVAEFGGADNVASVRDALHDGLTKRGIDASLYDPWYFPHEDEYSKLLDAAGFNTERIERYARPTPIGTSLEGWLTVFANPFLQALPKDAHTDYIAETAANAAKNLPRDAQGDYLLDYVRLRLSAFRI